MPERTTGRRGRTGRSVWRGGIVSLLLSAAGCAAAQPALPYPAARTGLPPGMADVTSKECPLPADGPTETSCPHLQQAAHVETAPPPAPSERPAEDRYPIDLATALRLAGANNLQIALAAERVRQAQARLEGANTLWLPSLVGGIGYTKHDGRIQDTQGNVIEVSRNSLFVGGGPTVGTIGVAGESTQPRMTVGFSLADALFTPLAERRTLQAKDAASASTFNDTLLQVALAYTDLVQAQGQVAIAGEAVANAQELERLVNSRVRAGTAPPADGLRAHAELAERRRQFFQSEEAVRVASTELVRLLRLDPAVTLRPAEDQLCPLALVETETPLPDLIAQALLQRPELAEQRALLGVTLARLRQEQWRPLIPTVQFGFGAGGFGGGVGSSVRNFSDRTDLDALVVWELRNLGFGNRALSRERASLNAQAELTVWQTSDRIASEVARAYHQVRQRQRQIEAAQDQVRAAAEALPLNFTGIQGGDLRAIEAQQAIQALAAARDRQVAAVLDYNRAQFQLLRALGRPPDGPHGDRE
jgi:outer membrane protein TolC